MLTKVQMDVLIAVKQRIHAYMNYKRSVFLRLEKSGFSVCKPGLGKKGVLYFLLNVVYVLPTDLDRENNHPTRQLNAFTTSKWLA